MKFILSILVLVRNLFLRLRWAADSAYAYLYTITVSLAGRLVSNAYAKIAEAQELAGVIRREADLLDKIKRG